MKPFFSIIIPTYNSLAVLKNCITSINSQTFTDYEILISDGNSSDGTHEYIKSNNIKNLAWFKLDKDNGLYFALNEALRNINGNWVLVLGADDILFDFKSLENLYIKLNNFLKQNISSNQVNFYTNIYIKRASGIILKKYPEFNSFSNMYDGLPPIHHQTLLMNSIFLNNGLFFNTAYKIHSDYDLMCSLMNSSKFVKIEIAIVVYNDAGMSSSIKTLFRSFFEIYKIRKSFNVKTITKYHILTYFGVLFHKLTYLFK